MAAEMRLVIALAFTACFGCGTQERTTSATSTAIATATATATATTIASATTAATDDQIPSLDAKVEPSLVAHAAEDGATCGALALPPAAFAVDPAPHAAGGWSFSVPDVDGDGRRDVATTSTAYRSVTGDAYAAVHVEEKPGCFRLVGIVFGAPVADGDPFAAWRTPGALLLRARSARWAPPRDEIADYRRVAGRLVLHRTRACFHRGEGGLLGCTAWVAAGDVALTPDRALAIPDDVPAAETLTPAPR